MKKKHDERPLSRREAIHVSLGAFGVAALGGSKLSAATRPAALPMTPAGQKFLVVIELDGGNDGLNTVVPQNLPNYQSRRPTLALGTAETLAIDTGAYATTDYRLHGAMPRIAQMYRDGEIGIVQKVGYPRPNGSHDTSKQIWAYGQRERLVTANGWIARYAELEAADTLGAVSLRRGRHRALVGGRTSPLTLDRLDRFRFDNDGSFSNNHARRLEIIREILDARASDATRDAMATGHQLADQMTAAVATYTSSVDYGTSGIGAALRDVATMLQAGFETRIFYTGYGGFDTHAAQGSTTGRHPDLLGNLDEALDAFMTDCKAMGIWNDCVVVVMSEFGRRNFENGSNGTDHGEGNVVLLSGGAVQPGLHGVPISNADLEERSLPYAVDFRAVYANVLEAHLGMTDASRVFPESYDSAAVNVV